MIVDYCPFRLLHKDVKVCSLNSASRLLQRFFSETILNSFLRKVLIIPRTEERPSTKILLLLYQIIHLLYFPHLIYILIYLVFHVAWRKCLWCSV